MLAIRMQRTGRKGYATFRIIVQDSRFSPKSGRVVARVGNYNPHTKDKSINIEVIEKYLKEGAQPTPRVVKLLTDEKVKLPEWVKTPDLTKKKKTKNASKLRKNQPEDPVAPKEEDVETSKVEKEEPSSEPLTTTEGVSEQSEGQGSTTGESPAPDKADEIVDEASAGEKAEEVADDTAEPKAKEVEADSEVAGENKPEEATEKNAEESKDKPADTDTK